MAKVTEQDIIDHLKEKISFYQDEARRLEQLLTAFTSDTSAQRRRAQMDAAGKTLDANDVQHATTPKAKKAAGVLKAAPPATPAQALEIPAKYTNDLTITDKIAFALNEIGSGFNEDIANAMAQYEPKSDAKTISRQISGVLSSLKSKGQVKAEKVGRKDRFSLV